MGRTLVLMSVTEQNDLKMVNTGHCIKRLSIRSYSGLYFPVFGLNMERHRVSLRIHSKCGKMQTRITPNTDTFMQWGLNKRTSNCNFR